MTPPNPFEARLVFIDGPLALYVHEASSQELLDAYTRIGRYLTIAGQQLDAEAVRKANRAVPEPPDDSVGGSGTEGSGGWSTHSIDGCLAPVRMFERGGTSPERIYIDSREGIAPRGGPGQLDRQYD